VKKCCIVGVDGYDVDALANMYAFYEGCGYSVVASRVPLPADLVVIQRGNGKSNIEFPIVPEAIHIYDYVRHGTSSYLTVVPKQSKTYVISPIDVGSCGNPISNNWIRGFYPVVPDLWMKDLSQSKVEYSLVHLGHKKPQDDEFQESLAALVLAGSVDVWGRGWSGPLNKVHGPISLHECSGIYRRSMNALGVMYGAQRWNSLSGRMWQGPLNGCGVYSESIAPTFDAPGVYVIPSYDNLEIVPSSLNTRIDLSRLSKSYWESETELLAKAMGLTYKRLSAYRLKYIYAKIIYFRHVNHKFFS
jgi:hypothetical protein